MIVNSYVREPDIPYGEILKMEIWLPFLDIMKLKSLWHERFVKILTLIHLEII